MRTKFYIPNNIFSKLFLSKFEDRSAFDFEFVSASMIAKNIYYDINSIGLIPSMDLVTNKNLFVSSEIGISFDAMVSNAYIHFKENQETIKELFLKGDVSSNEVILGKILFKEFYEVDIKTTLLSSEKGELTDNVLIIGDENYEKELFLKGLSFSEEIIELISAPYVNFLLAGATEESIKNFTKNHIESLSKPHTENVEKLYPTFPQSSLDFLKVNFQHVVFNFDEQDREGIKLLLQMPYYHGLIKEMIEVKFVELK
jgi:hypothetical protein